MSSQTLEGLKCAVAMPADFDPAKEHSLIVILHGAGGTETGVCQGLEFLTKEDFAIVAPKSRTDTWSAKDIEDVRKIVADLKTRLHVGPNRLHAVGFSNGGWNLAPVALDEALHFTSATWMAAGFKGGKLPKHAKKEMGVLALAGSADPNRDSAEATVGMLEGDVRWVGCRIQSGLGHAWPDKLMPFYGWWVGVQEGRFAPGVTVAFAWADGEDAARAAMAERKGGGFAYFFSKDDAAGAAAKEFQNVACLDLLVQRFGRQLVAWKVDRAEHADAFAAAGLKETPAVIVYGEDGKPRKTLSGKIAAKALADALRSVAPDKSLPKR